MSDTESIYQEYVILYLDILGFKEKVLSSVGNPEEQRVLQHFFDVKIPEIVKEYYVATQGQLKIISFSDSIVACYLLPNNDKDTDINIKKAVTEMLYVPFFLMTYIFFDLKLLVRGGLTIGPLYFTRNHKNLFGPGLIDAVKGDDTNQNPYPRVVVFDQFRLHPRLKVYESELEKYLVQDVLDNKKKYFYDHLNFSNIHEELKMENGYTLQDLHNISFTECVELLEKKIKAMPDSDQKDNLRFKQQWAVDYWNAYQNQRKSKPEVAEGL